MPPMPAVPNVIRVAQSGYVNTVQWANVYHFAYDNGPATEADLNTWAEGFYTHFGSTIAQCVGNTTTYGTIDVIDLTTPSSAVGGYSGPDLGDAIAAADNAVCWLVNHKIARRYRGGHPRTYIPGTGGANITSGNTWAETILGTMQEAVTSFYAACLAIDTPSCTGAQLVSVSYYTAGELRDEPLVDVVTGSTVSPMIATQRRRLGKRG
jgi:hypothetical protein